MSLSKGHPCGRTAVPEADPRRAFPPLLMCPEQEADCSEQRNSGCEQEKIELGSIHGPVKELLHIQEGSASGLTHLPGAQEATCHKQGDATSECAVSEDVENGICSSNGSVREPLGPQGTSATGHGHRSILRRFLGKRYSCHPGVILVLILLLFLLLASVVALAVQPCAAPQLPDCSPDWEEYNGDCYYFSKDYRTWDQAQERCSELGASLAIVKDVAMGSLFCIGGNGDYWVGLRRRGEHLQWEDGSRYNSSVPVLGNSECVYMADNKFRSFSCSNPQLYICSKARAPL